MYRRMMAAITLVVLLSAPGCGCIRAFEQWKCHHLGWCSGSRPACPPPVVVPPEAIPLPGYTPRPDEPAGGFTVPELRSGSHSLQRVPTRQPVPSRAKMRVCGGND
jgi:hypothetical protein